MIDLSRLPTPLVLEGVTNAGALAQFIERFLAEWTLQRTRDPSLPMFDAELLRSDPSIVLGRVFAYLRVLDRTSLNDAVRALIPHLSQGSNLDMLAASRNVSRLVLAAATQNDPAILESDERLLLRFLDSFERQSAGSRAAYRYIAMTAWPACHDAAVLGRSVHGRRGDVDVVLAGPAGRAPTQDEIAIVRAALNQPGVRPEATDVTVIAATRLVFDASISVRIPGGPDPDLVTAEVEARVRAMAQERLRIGAEVPRGAIAGAAYGPSVEFVNLDAPLADIPAQAYAIPILGALTIDWEVRQ